MGTRPARPRLLRVPPIMLAVLVLASCGGGGTPAARPTPSPTSVVGTATPLPLGSRPAGPDPDMQLKKLIVQRYVLYVRTLEGVLATNRADTPAVRDVATGPQLPRLLELARKNRSEGLTYRGVTKIDPSVVLISDDKKSAELRDCNDGSGLIGYKNGKPLGSSAPRRDGVKIAMLFVDGAWKVAGTEYRVGKCS